jgi:hypothetical protein
LHLILQHNGFGIEEAKGNSWRLIKEKLIDANVARTLLVKLMAMSREQLTTYLESQGFQPWFDVTPPVNTSPRPIVLESRTLDFDEE